MLPVDEAHFYIGEGVVKPGGKVIGAVEAAMTASGASKAHAKVCEFPLHVVPDVWRHKLLHPRKKDLNLALSLQKLYYRSVFAGKVLVLLIPARIVHSAAVKHISAPVLGSGYAILV